MYILVYIVYVLCNRFECFKVFQILKLREIMFFFSFIYAINKKENKWKYI